jgi:hypothetical protein
VKLFAGPNHDPTEIAVLEGQLTWLVHIISAILKGRVASSTAECQVIWDKASSTPVEGPHERPDFSGYYKLYYVDVDQSLFIFSNVEITGPILTITSVAKTMPI